MPRRKSGLPFWPRLRAYHDFRGDIPGHALAPVDSRDGHASRGVFRAIRAHRLFEQGAELFLVIDDAPAHGFPVETAVGFALHVLAMHVRDAVFRHFREAIGIGDLPRVKPFLAFRNRTTGRRFVDLRPRRVEALQWAGEPADRDLRTLGSTVVPFARCSLGRFLVCKG